MLPSLQLNITNMTKKQTEVLVFLLEKIVILMQIK